MSEKNFNPNEIQAAPTKDFFIKMLIKDINFKDAIGDLVDNSVDGARSKVGGGDYKGYAIKIDLDKDSFSIIDNCGGFSAETARKYAFHFGRPKDFPSVKGSVGQFGIGMKRAIFKLGALIVIESTTSNSYFKVTINVAEWQKKSEGNWSFLFDEVDETHTHPKKDWGTKIHVTKLTKDASDQFSDQKFISELCNEIQKENMYNINNGLKISIGPEVLKGTDLDIISNKEIIPAFYNRKIGKVSIKIYAGIGTDELEQGGWYIFCNDRLIVGPEKTSLTGWTGRGGDGVAIYHDQFARFRGYVFFNSEDSSNLPWNTTKTGVDADSPLFIAIRQVMIDMMKPVITFLNKLKKEREADNPPENQVLNIFADKAKIVKLTSVDDAKLKDVFVFPNLQPSPKLVKDIAITFYRPQEKIEEVGRRLKLKMRRKIGEAVFDYYYENEIG